MAKKSKTNGRKKRQASVRAAQSEESGLNGITRRGLLRGASVGVLGVAAMAGAGFAGRSMYRSYVQEHDLSQIGKGKPVVVQVHDPQCPTCTALQRETRKAMNQFGECDLVYLIADITQPEGQVFASRHSVPHVTLMLFDGEGEVVSMLSGMRQRAELGPIFKAHFERYGVKV